jgi:Ca2+/Na+ antiporter
MPCSTVPDVRFEKYTKWYPATMIISVLWLAFLAEFMMNSAETMGCILTIPEDIMGLTFTAAGTSLPNLFASLIVAKQGLGNMSISNAFGSNTFNIFMCATSSSPCYFPSCLFPSGVLPYFLPLLPSFIPPSVLCFLTLRARVLCRSARLRSPGSSAP